MNKSINERTDYIDDYVDEELEEIIEDMRKNDDEPKILIGYVTGCDKLNLREGPSISSRIYSTIRKGSEVEIDAKNSTDDFYKIVSFSDGEFGSVVDAYCMKKFIALK